MDINKLEEGISIKDKCNFKVIICSWEERSKKGIDWFCNGYIKSFFNNEFKFIKENNCYSEWN